MLSALTAPLLLTISRVWKGSVLLEIYLIKISIPDEPAVLNSTEIALKSQISKQCRLLFASGSQRILR